MLRKTSKGIKCNENVAEGGIASSIFLVWEGHVGYKLKHRWYRKFFDMEEIWKQVCSLGLTEMVAILFGRRERERKTEIEGGGREEGNISWREIFRIVER